MSEQLKLTLTSQALEKILGGNEECLIEIRQGIAKEFAKRHLAGVLNEVTQNEIAQAIKAYKTAVQEMIKQQIRDGFASEIKPDSTWLRFIPALPDSTLKEIKDKIKQTFDIQVAAHLEEQVKKIMTSPEWRADVERRMTTYAVEFSKREIRSLVDSFMDKFKSAGQ